MADYAKCDDKFLLKFGKIEAKFGAACQTSNDAATLMDDATLCAAELRCQAIELIGPSVSIIAVPDLSVTDTEDLTVRVRNVGESLATVYCGYVPDACSPVRDFEFEISPFTTVEWSVKDGALLPPLTQIPAIATIPFSGQLFCVQTAERVSFPGDLTPVSKNELIAWTVRDGGCPVRAVGIRGLPPNDEDATIVFRTEYDPCPPELDSNFIESCWSNAVHVNSFICGE